MGNSLWGAILIVIFGIFCIICSIANWDWYFNHRKAQLFVSLFGRTGARIFYICTGVVLMVLGIKMYMKTLI